MSILHNFLHIKGKIALAATILAIAVPCPAIAENSLQAQSKLVLQINTERLTESEIGRWLFDVVKQKLAEEIAKSGEATQDQVLEQINQILGFDPFEDIQHVTLAISDYQRPERSLSAVVNMKSTTGNLEGLLLVLPGYQVETYRDQKIHMATPNDEMPLYVAIRETKDQSKQVVLTVNRSLLEQMVDQLDGRRGSTAAASWNTTEFPDRILHLEVLELPAEAMGEGPHTNFIKLLDQFSLQVDGLDQSLQASVRVSAKNRETNEQLYQLAQGFVGMLGLAKMLDSDDEDLQKLAELVQQLNVTRVDDAVSVSLQLSSQKLKQLIEAEMD